MVPYDPTITRALRWMQNRAPRITAIITQKDQWYDRYNQQFWQQWEGQIFDLRTANPFGLAVWCIILGLPLDIFNFEPLTNAWAYGPQRGNYIGIGVVPPFTFTDGPHIYVDGLIVPDATVDDQGEVVFVTAPAAGAILKWSGTYKDANDQGGIVVNVQFGVGDGVDKTFSLVNSSPPDENTIGYNFQGGGDESVSLLSDVRYACQLRYVALLSNGKQQWINQMLMYIFNNNEPWDMTSGKYFYLTDSTQDQSAIPNMTMEYHVGPNLPVSAQFLNILNNREYGITPQSAGVPYTVIQDA